MSTELSLTTTGDAGDDAWRRRPYDRDRDVHLLFVKTGSGYDVYAMGKAFPNGGGGSYRGRITVGADNDLMGALADLRHEWDEVLGTQIRDDEGNHFPFVDDWDLSTSKVLTQEKLDRAWLGLARAGNAVFVRLFGRHDDSGTCRNHDPGLCEISKILVRTLRNPGQVIMIESEDLFIPWGMLYTSTGPEQPWGTEPGYRLAGFWGYAHLVEHVHGRMHDFDSRIVVDPAELTVSVNVDRGVDNEPPPTLYVQPMIDFFEGQTRVDVRTNRDDLALAFRDPTYGPHIVYFGCHCQNESLTATPYLVLGDDRRITSTQFQSWLDCGGLPSRPVVFVGACKGGRMSSIFYPSFGRHLLKHTRSLVGPETDLPRAFAREYALGLFSRFLRSDTKLGDAIHEVTQEFCNRYRNPLGLAFSLFRGMDVHLHWDPAA